MCRVRIHCCLLDRDCRSVGKPARVNIRTRNWFVIVALAPGSRVTVRRDDAPPYVKGEPWNPDLYRSAWITVDPVSDANPHALLDLI